MHKVMLVVLLALAACDSAPPAGQQVFGPAASTGGLAQGGLGADCAMHGASDCVGGLCVRATSVDARCTRECSSAAPCPDGWKCAPAGTSTTRRWCVAR